MRFTIAPQRRSYDQMYREWDKMDLINNRVGEDITIEEDEQGEKIILEEEEEGGVITTEEVGEVVETD